MKYCYRSIAKLIFNLFIKVGRYIFCFKSFVILMWAYKKLEVLTNFVSCVIIKKRPANKSQGEISRKI